MNLWDFKDELKSQSHWNRQLFVIERAKAGALARIYYVTVKNVRRKRRQDKRACADETHAATDRFEPNETLPVL